MSTNTLDQLVLRESAFIPAQPTARTSSRTVPLWKQLTDPALALLLLLALLPVMMLLSLAVLSSGRGGVLYRQERVGLRGRTFTVLKFRTMRPDAHAQRVHLRTLNEGNGVLFKIRADPRTTKIGRLLRRFSLDELPQLINVLRGEMSLVGPRPALPEEVATYPPHVRDRLLVKPGLTGLWQVSGRSDLSWADSVRFDLEYVARLSPRLDAMILLRTVAAVAHGRGAY